MNQVIQSHPELKRDYELLLTIPSVGFVTAAVVLAEFGDLRRFGTARQIGAHAGVTAAKVESGAQASSGRMSKKGSARVRQALYMASLTAILHNPPLRDVYARLSDNGKEHMVAVGAVMRKLLVLMRAVVVSGKPFNRSGKPSGEVSQHG
jgi:transposase